MAEGLIESLVVQNESKIFYFIIDGLGGMVGEDGSSELQVAHIPHLDHLAKEAICGLADPVLPGITPGSGPGHLALFGYDPVEFHIGRGVLSALGVEFPLRENDVAARINFATADKDGRIVDRRAGRISDEQCHRLCQTLRQRIRLANSVEFFLQPEKEHRAVLILRGKGLGAEVSDTDPQKEGLPPVEPAGKGEGGRRTAETVREVVRQAQKILADEERANTILLRGFAQYRRYPSVQERFGLKAAAFADYPFYRGVARLVGMDAYAIDGGWRNGFATVRETLKKYDFVFFHVKEADSRGEDGDFAGKVKALEDIDAFLPQLLSLRPDVLVVTGDHSTPARIKGHSWHPVPILLWASTCRRDSVERFDEESCARGGLGRLPMKYVMNLALAHAGKLAKFGA